MHTSNNRSVVFQPDFGVRHGSIGDGVLKPLKRNFDIQAQTQFMNINQSVPQSLTTINQMRIPQQVPLIKQINTSPMIQQTHNFQRQANNYQMQHNHQMIIQPIIWKSEVPYCNIFSCMDFSNQEQRFEIAPNKIRSTYQRY